MKPKEIKVNGVTYVPKQEERKQNKPLLNLRMDEDEAGIQYATVVANGICADIISAWVELSYALLDQMDVDLAKGISALVSMKGLFHCRSED